jgi:hypothetical protein
MLENSSTRSTDSLQTFWVSLVCGFSKSCRRIFKKPSGSRAPKTLRVVAFIPLVAGIATPFVGIERAQTVIEWWTHQGSGVVRLTAVPLLALGGFIAYACAPARRAA